MGTDDNIIDLLEYKGRGRDQSDIKTMIRIHDEILTIEDESLREEMRRIWFKATVVLFCESPP